MKTPWPSPRIEPLEARIAPSTLLGLDTANHLLRFNSASPDTLAANTTVTGLGGGETLVGIDFRPATGQLYGVTIDGGNVGHLYSINPVTGAATLTATLAADPTDLTAPYTTLSGTSFGLDFNPVPDRLRVVSDTNQNLRINPNNGLVTTDSDLNPGAPDISGAAYTNSFPGATTTTLFDIDTASDSLVIQNPPNNGTLMTVGPLGVDATGVAGFDIGQGKNEAFAELTVGATTQLYAINLSTGAATAAGNIGLVPTALRGLTVLLNTWSGAGGDDRTLTASNWVSGLVPAAGDALLFPAGAAQLTVASNHPTDTTFNTLRFTGGGYTLAPFLAAKTSDGFRLNFSTGTVTVDAAWTLASPSGPSVIEVAQAGATLALNAGLISDAGLTVTGLGSVQIAGLADSSEAGQVTINGPSVTVSGTGWLKPTVVQNGTLVVNGVFASALVTMQGGTLSGTGSVVEIDAPGGILRSGADSLALEADLTLAAGSTAQFDLPAAGGFEPLLVPGTVTLGGGLTVNAPGIVPAQFILIKNGDSDAISATFTGLAEGAPVTIGADIYAISYRGGDGNDVTLTRSSGLGIPAISGSGKIASFTDVDGDHVTVAITRGTLTTENFILRDLGGGRSQLELIDFRGDSAFAETNLTITARRDLAGGGDGSVNVGYLNATGLDLGLVKIAGDLAAIDAGDATPTDRALKGLNVQSLGVLGFSTGAADRHSDLNGRVDALTVRGDVREATVLVFDSTSDIGANSGAGNAIIGSLTIGGSISGGAADGSGSIEARDAILNARITGGIRGGGGKESGRVIGLDKLGSVTVGGSISGGAGEASGRLEGGATGSVQVRGSIEGGAGAGSGGAGFAALGSLAVTGSIRGGDGLLSGRVAAFTAKAIKLTHDLRGGAGGNSGSVEVDGAIGSLSIGGSLVGGGGSVSGSIINGLDAIATLQIKGSIIGGAGTSSGFISGFAVTALSVGGSLFGGTGVNSARIEPFSLTTVKIGGSLYGVAEGSASTFSSTTYSVTIGGSVFGGAPASGTLVSNNGFTAIKIGGDLQGGTGIDSGSIQSIGNLPTLTLGGSLIAGTAARSGSVLVAQAVGTVTIGGGIAGTAAQPAIISALGSAAPSAAADLALKSLTVKRSVHFARILAGYDATLIATNADAQIGSINVGGDWLASSVAAGVQDVSADGFGNGDDAKISGPGTTNDPNFHSKIASIVIKGQAFGTVTSGDHFGFVAQEIGALTIGVVKFPLTVLPFNDDLTATDPRLLIGPTGDLRVHEVAL